MKRSHVAVLLLCLLTLLLTACWDRIELEDQVFPTVLAIDVGSRHRYRVILRITPLALLAKPGQVQQLRPQDLMEAECDNLSSGILSLNAAAARRISLRHVRAVLLGESLVRRGIQDLLIEIARAGEISDASPVFVGLGDIMDHMRMATFPGETTSSKISEGLNLVARSLHMAPPSRIHHLTARGGSIGVDPMTSLVAINPAVTQGQEPPEQESAKAGELGRRWGNPVEQAGTAVFRDRKLAGFLNIDQTQALLSLRGEMGKVYMSMPDPYCAGCQIIIRYHQENRPRYRAYLTPAGPRVDVTLLFEGEVLSGSEDYGDAAVRHRVEALASAFMKEREVELLERLKEWKVDPAGFGLHFRGMFATWDDWNRFNWRNQIPRLQVKVDAKMRLRRFGLVEGGTEH